MEERLDEKELVILLELLMPHIIQLNTITELLSRKVSSQERNFLPKGSTFNSNTSIRQAEAGKTATTEIMDASIVHRFTHGGLSRGHKGHHELRNMKYRNTLPL